jgi:hypothetical protein
VQTRLRGDMERGRPEAHERGMNDRRTSWLPSAPPHANNCHTAASNYPSSIIRHFDLQGELSQQASPSNVQNCTQRRYQV